MTEHHLQKPSNSSLINKLGIKNATKLIILITSIVAVVLLMTSVSYASAVTPLTNCPAEPGPYGAGPWGSSTYDTLIFNTGNGGGVSGGGTSSGFTLIEPTFIGSITTYHWNGGSGAPAGTISLDGSGCGSWQTTGMDTNRYWNYNPYIVLEPGTYTVIDSDPSTWAQNGGSGGNGMFWIYGHVATGDYTAPNNPNVSSVSHTVGVPSNNATIDILLSDASDDAGGSGIDGFSYSFTEGAASSLDIPDTIKDIEESSTDVTGTLAAGTWYFHIRTVDNSGNWSSTAHSGPYLIKSHYEETSGQIVYKSSCWNNYNNVLLSGGTAKISKKKSCTATFSYTGTKVEFIAAKAKQLGKTKIYVDNVLQTTLDLYNSSTLAKQVVYSKTHASSGAHTIKVEVLATKNTKATGYYIPVDAFDVTS